MKVITIVHSSHVARNWTVTYSNGKNKPEEYRALDNAGNAAAKAVSIKQHIKDAIIVGDERALKFIPESLR